MPEKYDPLKSAELTTEQNYNMLNELVDYIKAHQAEKIDGIWAQHLVIHYNCMGAIFIPDVFPLPAPQVSVNTRKGVVVNYAPIQLAV